MSLIYAKDSFDRFGDDLMEVLLSFIPFEDTFQYKCVSKQWKRLVFNKQNKLIICNFGSKIKYFKRSERILSEFAFGRRVGNEYNFLVIKLIFKNCPNIKSIN